MNICARKISLPKIRDTKSYWMGYMTAKGKQELTVLWLFSTKHLTSRHLNLDSFLLHMSCGTQEANFCACIILGLVYVDFSSIEFCFGKHCDDKDPVVSTTNATGLICP